MNLALWCYIGLTLYGRAFSKLIDLVPDPYFTSLTYWQTQPFLKICRNCTNIPTVGPSIPGGLYFFDEPSYFESTFVELYTPVIIPSGVTSVTLDFTVQVETGDFTLTVSLLDYAWTYSIASLSRAQGVYANFSNYISFAPFSKNQQETLKFIVSNTATVSQDYLSINQAHLYCDVSEDYTKMISIIIISVIFCIAALVSCYCYLKMRARQLQKESYQKL